MPPLTMDNLRGKSVCFTGKMAYPREELKQMSQEAGMINHTTVHPFTQFLVMNPLPDGHTSKKHQAARRYGVRILTEQEFMDAIWRT